MLAVRNKDVAECEVLWADLTLAVFYKLIDTCLVLLLSTITLILELNP